MMVVVKPILCILKSILLLSCLVLKDEEKKVVFLVTDSGPGIESKYLVRIFERYFQVPGRHDKKGSGIGLAICKDFMEAMGGEIWVESQMGKGSTFGFSLKTAEQN